MALIQSGKTGSGVNADELQDLRYSARQQDFQEAGLVGHWVDLANVSSRHVGYAADLFEIIKLVDKGIEESCCEWVVYSVPDCSPACWPILC